MTIRQLVASCEVIIIIIIITIRPPQASIEICLFLKLKLVNILVIWWFIKENKGFLLQSWTDLVKLSRNWWECEWLLFFFFLQLTDIRQKDGGYFLFYYSLFPFWLLLESSPSLLSNTHTHVRAHTHTHTHTRTHTHTHTHTPEKH